jgi:hypothetical protein
MGDMIANLFVNIFGALIFLFLFWKKLKDDHVPEIIFSAAYLIIGAIAVSYFVSLKFFPDWFFWSEVVAISAAFAFSVYKFRMSLYETLDALVISILPWFSLTFLKDSVVNSSLTSFIGFIVILIFIFIYYFLESRYKRFTWYRSGKIGFSGLSTLMILFLVRAGTSLYTNRVLTFTGIYEPYLSGGLVIISILTILYLGKIEE